MRLTGLLICAAALVRAGNTAPAFEVASFHRRPPGASHGPTAIAVSPDGVTLRNATLGNCIEWAYGYRHFRVVGPAWRDYPTDIVYEIAAKASAPAPESELKRMLQTLLQERLGLAFHLENRELPIYALAVDRNGPKFHRSETAGDPFIKSLGLGVDRFERYTMAAFADSLDPGFEPIPVFDETGLTGAFDFTLDISAYILDESGRQILDARGAIDVAGADLQALPRQLGLRLQRKTAPYDVMVIDRVQKDPSEN